LSTKHTPTHNPSRCLARLFTHRSTLHAESGRVGYYIYIIYDRDSPFILHSHSNFGVGVADGVAGTFLCAFRSRSRFRSRGTVFFLTGVVGLALGEAAITGTTCRRICAPNRPPLAVRFVCASNVMILRTHSYHFSEREAPTESPCTKMVILRLELDLEKSKVVRSSKGHARAWEPLGPSIVPTLARESRQNAVQEARSRRCNTS